MLLVLVQQVSNAHGLLSTFNKKYELNWRYDITFSESIFLFDPGTIGSSALAIYYFVSFCVFVSASVCSKRSLCNYDARRGLMNQKQAE